MVTAGANEQDPDWKKMFDLGDSYMRTDNISYVEDAMRCVL